LEVVVNLKTAKALGLTKRPKSGARDARDRGSWPTAARQAPKDSALPPS